jgi:dimethylhistidine N-methyltransferase
MSASLLRSPAFFDLHPEAGDLRAEVLAGLRRTPKSLPPKLFYDQTGSELFERITALPEYYPTRTEIAILEARGAEIARLAGADCVLIEYVSGASRKIRILLDALSGRSQYVAIDISKQHLIESTAQLAAAYPDIEAFAVCADYTRPFTLPAEALTATGRRIVFFPGSTVGNFSPIDAREFLTNTARQVGPQGGLLIGVDLKKDAATLNAAYNDSRGVTAQFNRNLLAHINRALGADFDVSLFDHRAFYNQRVGRIEMHLVSRRGHTVTVAGERIHFAEGESIHTENSYKFSIEEFQQLARDSGFRPERAWTDAANLFSLHYMTVTSQRSVDLNACQSG